MANRTGTCKWMGTPDKQDLRDGTALLRIETRTGCNLYWVFQGRHETRIKKMGNGGETYAVNLQSGWCECPDHQQRKTCCKHVKALRAALPRIKDDPKPQPPVNDDEDGTRGRMAAEERLNEIGWHQCGYDRLP